MAINNFGRLFWPLLAVGVLLLGGQSALAASGPKPDQAPIQILLSTDTGNEIDDQWVLLHALIDKRLEVVGIVSALSPAASIDAPAAKNSAITIRQIIEERMGMAVHPPIFVGSDDPLMNETTARPSEGASFIIDASKSYSAKRRLTVVTTGAATDVASALLIDPTLADRVRIVAMGFRSWEKGGVEFNIENDPAAWRVILQSTVPVVIGDATVTTRDLSMTRAEVVEVLAGGRALQSWLVRDYDLWNDAFARTATELRRPDGTQSWVIWDEVSLAYLLGYTTTRTYPRPVLAADLSFQPGKPGSGTIEWVTSIDRPRLWADYARLVSDFARTHAVRDQPCVTFGRSPLACWRKETAITLTSPISQASD